jgi:hypothetical protein
MKVCIKREKREREKKDKMAWDRRTEKGESVGHVPRGVVYSNANSTKL